MKTEVYLEPETEAEREFMERLAHVRNQALDDGMSKAQVSRVLSIYAQSLVSGSFDQRSNDPNTEEKSLCPECGCLIEGVEVTGIGEEPTVLPCGCTVGFNELPEEVQQDMLG